MSAFDDLTLGEVEMMSDVALGGKSISDADPLMLSGAVMWVTERKQNPSLTWDDFKAGVKMGDIKAFSEKMKDDADLADPTLALNASQS